MDTSDKIRVRIKMLGGRIDDGVLEYLAQKSLLAAKGFCNVDEFPDEAGTFLAEWAQDDDDFYRKLGSVSDQERHEWINSQIQEFFKRMEGEQT